ncbi:glycosyltransferase [Actinopolyspora halophila]|uniref:glycosyltransferase n=1 Tax=Actinopolyspora halophila TaxID=1850 RepID=UPI00036F25D7|nr:glycosyltransferase [Actinopolyspora halophila]
MIGWVIAGGVVLTVWLWLLTCHGRFWSTDQRLPGSAEPHRWPSVAVVIPARREADVLPRTLPTVLAQHYPAHARVILVDDDSDDGTGELAGSLARETGAGLPLTVTAPGSPPQGWTGKTWALAHGVVEAGQVDRLLFTDADIAHAPDSLTELVRACESGYDLVSQMAVLRTDTRWERLIVPAFVYFFAMLFPFRRVNRPASRTAAAAGGCVLLRRVALERAGGLSAISGALIDDVALARLVERAGGRGWLGLAGKVHSVRSYPRMRDLWHMISRSAYTQLRHSPTLLTGTVLGLALVFLGPPAVTIAGLAGGGPIALLLGAAAWAIMAGTFAPMLRYYGQPGAAASLLPVTAVLYVLMTLDSARRHRYGHGTSWKGRDYPATPFSEREPKSPSE